MTSVFLKLSQSLSFFGQSNFDVFLSANVHNVILSHLEQISKDFKPSQK